MRNISFADNEFYHIYNRGVDKRKIFLCRGHYLRFLKTISNLLKIGFARIPLVTDQSLAFSSKLSFISFCLMPNHHHFLIKQLEDNGITDFMHRLDTSYTKYFNLNNHRTGRLFEGTFKAVHIVSEEQLVHLSRYIHLNPLLAGFVSDLDEYPWSSYAEYVGNQKEQLCHKEEILNYFGGDDKIRTYQEFVSDQTGYAKELQRLKDIVLEELI